MYAGSMFPILYRRAMKNSVAGKKWLYALFSAAFISGLILLSSITGFSSSYYAFSSDRPFTSIVNRGPGHPPAFAYYISGGKGEAERMFRLLLALYHPRNRYLLHVGVEGSEDERRKLGVLVKSVPAIRAFGNVDLVGKPDPATYMGSTHIAAILRAAAILLKVDSGWDWFITLSARDYPLVSQDDLSHVFSYVRRDLNFIDHSSDLGWKKDQRVMPVVVDPGIYLARRTQIFYASQKRPMPESFRVFTGSPWVILSRSFLEFCIFGWDNLPRTLLMYFTNSVLSQEVYFHSVICNSLEFKNTTVNGDLRYFVWDNPPKMEPHFLNASDYEGMVQSGAAFARQFGEDGPVLDMIDKNILERGRNRVAPGAWCTGRKSWLMDPCSQWGDVNVLKTGRPEAKRLAASVSKLIEEWQSQSNQCR
ncbi:PREDICTED: beta-glucuronosyltransferase GlcAT14A-like [Ipomoea nil]|uniref:beta-glucuronosyltransferase GlcAT14A-like n=1 Tax=Ipomoea nil TaxID=35883 RepID=UPI000901473D|nr:PREDICTED: beta-glucuronosyltransferase GlcAT14A-like [Ipomoea nil]XP_019164816.1 PREDICTED: beta-glucuronosyltransferase GlcAT14A-like [Ipomoea nil]